MADKDKQETGKSQAEGNEQTGSGGESVINTVARTVGSAIGVVASGTSKVLKAVEGEGRETKSKRQSPAGDKLSERRKANKKKKRAAHKRKLRRSSSRG